MKKQNYLSFLTTECIEFAQRKQSIFVIIQCKKNLIQKAFIRLCINLPKILTTEHIELSQRERVLVSIYYSSNSIF